MQRLTVDEAVALRNIVAFPQYDVQLTRDARATIRRLRDRGLIWRKGQCWHATEEGERLIENMR